MGELPEPEVPQALCESLREFGEFRVSPYRGDVLIASFSVAK